MNSRDRQKRRDGDLALPCSVRKHDDVHAIAHRSLYLARQAVERLLEGRRPRRAPRSRCERLARATLVPRPYTKTARKRWARKPTRLMAQMLSNSSRVSSGRCKRTSWQDARESSSRLPCGCPDRAPSRSRSSRAKRRSAGSLPGRRARRSNRRTVLLGEACKRRVDAHRGERGRTRACHGAQHLVHVVPNGSRASRGAPSRARRHPRQSARAQPKEPRGRGRRSFPRRSSQRCSPWRNAPRSSSL